MRFSLRQKVVINYIIAVGAAVSVYVVESRYKSGFGITGLFFKMLILGFLFFLMQRELRHRERVEKTLRESEERFKQLVQHANDIIYQTDEKGFFTFVNPTVERILGYKAEELVGRSFLYPVTPSWRERVEQFYQRQIDERTPNTYYRFPLRRKDGMEIWVGQNVQLTIEGGTIVGTQAIARDITLRVQLEEELGRTRDAALESARLKSEFMANMSHEIRNPMNGIIGMTSLLSDTELDQDQRRFVDAIRQSADALLGIINNILDFSKIKAGKLQVESVDFDLCLFIEGIISLFIEPAESKKLELTSFIDPAVPPLLHADYSLLRQVLINLLGNAIKFTNEGEVALTVTCLYQAETYAELHFEVRDTGIGISEEARRGLFTPFVQADSSTTRRFGGSGLGLVISKDLVEAMGGQMGLDSRPGRGSKFWFTLKVERTRASLSKAPPRTDLQGLRALIADNRTTSSEVLSKQLRSWDIDVTEVDDFDAALNALRASANSDSPFDLALIDHQIQGRDGLDLARAIMQEKDIPRVRMILLSTFGHRPSEEAIREAGIQLLLTKPVRQSQLYDGLLNLISGQYSGKSDSTPKPMSISVDEASSSAGVRFNSSRLLVVEDNPINQEVAICQLEKIGYKADVAKDGTEALQMLDRHDYALVLMDCHMPGMDGFEATTLIRSRLDKKRDLPIIAVTASATADERKKCLQVGMDDFLAKPFKHEELSAKITIWLSDASQSPRNNNDLSDEVPHDGMTDVIDRLKELEEDYGKKMVLKVVGMFTPDTEVRIERIVQAIKQEDFKALEEAAHGLKSSAANVGATEIAKLCQLLETQGELGSIGDSAELLNQLVASWSEVRELLSQYR